MALRDPLAAFLRDGTRVHGMGRWALGAFRDAYPAAFDEVCREVEGFASWPAAPWSIVEGGFRKVEADAAVLEDWRALLTVAEAVDYPTEKLAETLQFVRAAVDALYGYADRSRASGLYDDARILAAAIAHAFATLPDEAETIAEGVERWRGDVGRSPGR